MKKILRIVLCLLVIACFVPRFPATAQGADARYEMYIGYELPSDPNLASDAQVKEAEYLQDRNTADQACRPEDLSDCKKQNEIAFRKEIASIPGVKFWLAFESCPGGSCENYVHQVCTFYPEEITDPGVDLNMDELPQSGRYQALGLYADSRCAVHRTSDGATVDFPAADEICKYQGDQLSEAAAAGNTDRVNALLDAGANPNQQGDWDAPIVAASRAGHADIVQALLSHGADPGVYLNLPLYLAASNGYPDVAEALLKSGAGDEDSVQNALDAAASNGYLQTVEVLVNHAIVSSYWKALSGAPLEDAASQGRLAIVKVLMSKGMAAFGLLPWACGYTPPAAAEAAAAAPFGKPRELYEHQSASSPAPTESREKMNRLGVVKFLVTSGYRVDWCDSEVNSDAETPLAYAAARGYLDIVKYLVGRGANVNGLCRPGDGLSPLRAAIQNGRYDVARFLRAHGARK